MKSERRVRLFRNGKNQALRIPREWELPGKEARIWHEGDRLVVEAVAKRSLRVVLAGLEPLEEDFAPAPDFPPEPVDP